MSGGVPAGEGLKACPFCNAAAAVFWYDGFPQVRCDKCGAATGMFTTGDEREAITAWNTRATPTPPIEGRDADVERVEAPENGEKRPDWAEIKRAIDYFVGRVPTISKHRAINNAHIRAVVERLDAAGDREAADTIVWQCWWRAIDAERERFLLADKDEQIAALQALGERG